MKVPKRVFGTATVAVFSHFASLALAQTCAAGIQASNPASVYSVDRLIGTVTDSRTALMWDRCPLGLSGTACATGTASTFTWQAALNAAASVGTYKGYNDWRLPNLKELRSLVEECRANPGINEIVFPNTATASFWSGSLYAGNTTDAWNVYFYFGSVSIDSRSNAFQVRLVRGGQ